MDTMTPIIIDLEASGFGPGSYPIEVGYVLDDGFTFCSLIQPLDEWTHWDSSSEQIHNISRELLFKKGSSARLVAEQLNEGLAGRTIYSDAWSHDLSWLGLLYHSVDMQQNFRMESLRSIMTEEQTMLWHATKEAITQEMHTNRHRASADAMIIQKTYLRTQQLAVSDKTNRQRTSGLSR